MASKDKMIWTASGENMIASNIATKMEAIPPAAKHMVELLRSQDSAAREYWTRTVVVALGGALLKQCVMLLISGIDASVISDALHKTAAKAVEILNAMAVNGGGAPVIELSRQLSAWAKVLHGMESNCVKSFAEALEAIPYTIDIVTELRNKHAQGHITNILEENVVQPLLVSASGITFAIEVITKVLNKLNARNSS
ncbi:unnamed protein product [Brassica oleracea var. botrytis]|uniref:Uncharacterized protein n=1 Tax=Brassica carinata TaxID=52824 RepID=A0A8X7UXM9_BRACI|nr:hypothetical protein Bca52824_042769 [Brassica carinata]